MAGPTVVIIGAGVVGAALADELSARGWDRVTVVDQGTLPKPGGSSSHAPGLVFQTNAAKVMTAMARYTVEKLTELGCFLPVGSIEVATTPQRLAELHRRHGWATAFGVPAEVLSPARTLALHDLLDPDVVLGALYVPTDGLAKAVDAVRMQLERAQSRGVRVLDRHEVLDIRTQGGRVTAVITDQGELPADVVVCCAGIWGPRVARMVGMSLPLTPLVHQLAWSDPLPALSKSDPLPALAKTSHTLSTNGHAAQSNDPSTTSDLSQSSDPLQAGAPSTTGDPIRTPRGSIVEASRPIVRHQGADLYFRERFDRLGVGSYAHAPMPVDPDAIPAVADAEVMPSVLAFTSDDFAPSWLDAAALFPALRTGKLAEGINGLFSFTTDNMPLLGPSSQVEGFWVAEAVWVTHSAAVGRAMAEWLVDGHVTSFDVHECDVNRFEPHQLSPEYVLTKDCQNYVEVYDIIHPLEPMSAPRPLRTSPFYPRQQELGAYFLEAAGWERPQWYEANAHLVDTRDVPIPNDWAAKHWSPIVGAEALVARESVAMFDMTALKRLEVSGRGATAFLQWMTTGDVDKSVGSVTYCLLLDVDGGVRSDITVARLGANTYQVGVNGNLDLDWLRRHASDEVSVRDITPGTCCVGLWGPRAREVVSSLTRDSFPTAMRYFRATTTFLGSVPVTAMRLSYVGELGWELYTTADQGLKLWDTLWEAGRECGIIAAGRGAFTSMRLEKGYRSFGADLTFEHDPYEAGLGFAVKLDKGDFLGRTALLKRPTPQRRLTCLTIDDPAAVVMGKEPVYAKSGCVGYVTSAAFGYTVGRGIAYAWLPVELTEPGQTLQIGYFDHLVRATVTPEPLFDPEMRRLRG